MLFLTGSVVPEQNSLLFPHTDFQNWPSAWYAGQEERRWATSGCWMMAVRHPTMTSLYLSSHYTTGMRTASTMCSILVPPCCSSVQHQRKTEGLLLCVHSSSKTTWHNLKMHSQPLHRGSTRTWTSYKHAQEQLATSHSSYFFFLFLCQWQIAKVATQAKEQYLRSLQDNEPQIHISSGSSGLSSSLILKNEDQVRSN